MILRRRFAEVISRQLDVFAEDEATGLLAEVAEMKQRYDDVGRDGAEEAYGDYMDVIDAVKDALADMRDRFASTLDEGPAEVGQAVFDPPRRFGMAFDKTVVLEPAQRLGEDLARDAADEVDQLTVLARLQAEREEHEHGPFVRDDLDRQARGAVSEEDRPGRVLHEIEGTRR